MDAADKTSTVLVSWVVGGSSCHTAWVQETLLQSLFLQKHHVLTAAAEAMARLPHFLFSKIVPRSYLLDQVDLGPLAHNRRATGEEGLFQKML